MNPRLLPENVTRCTVIHLLFQTGARFLPVPLPDARTHLLVPLSHQGAATWLKKTAPFAQL